MRRLLKILLTTLLVLVAGYWTTKAYLKYSARKHVTEKVLREIVSKINTAPTLPRNFKDMYCRVYPGVLEQGFTSNLAGMIFGDNKEQCPSRQVANHCWTLFANHRSNFGRNLDYVGFTWLIEDYVTQEKCFEYLMSHFDFLHNKKGPYEAALFYFNKPLESLNVDEQLGLILKIRNPSIYDNLRWPDEYKRAITELKVKIGEAQDPQ